MLILALMMLATEPSAYPGEQPVDPYAVSDANAGALPLRDDRAFRAFNGKDGIDRIVAAAVRLWTADPRISDIFKNHDLVRLERTLGEQFCYILGGGCAYSGRDMKTAHKDLGLQTADVNALIEGLQIAMDAERVPFGMQNKLLARLAPMKRDVVER